MFAWTFAAFALVLAAQEAVSPSPEILLRANIQQRKDWAVAWLGSQDPLRIAWGAWLANQDRLTDLIPLLTLKVAEYQPVESERNSVERDQHDALLVVLDALIQLRGTVPVQHAYKLYPEFAAQSMILLIRSPDDATTELLSILDKAKANWNWLAAGNALSKTPTAGFASLLLSRFTQHLKVWVTDRGIGGGEFGGGSECGFSLRGPKVGWPRVGLYALTQFPGRLPAIEARFLIGGETPVYYLRADPGNYDNPPDDPYYCDGGDRDKYRAQYLAQFYTASWPKVVLPSYPEAVIVWQDQDAYRGDLLRAVEEKRKLFGDAILALQDHGLTDEEASSLQPRIEVVIRDIRHERSTPLPVVSSDASMEVVADFRKPLN